jgi:hypothetical protein
MAGLRGAGKVYLSTLRGGSYGGYLDMANIASFTIGSSGADTTTLKSTAPANYGAVIGSATTPGDDTISIALNVPNRKNLTAMLLGTDTGITVTGSSITNEMVTPLALDSFLPLTKRHVSAVSVTSKDADDTGTWVGSTVTALGAYIKPTVANTYYYKCTTAGTTAGSQPTWGTTIGGTTTDGTVTWTNMGLITKSSTVDYDVDADNGLIGIRSGATSVEVGRPLNVDYTYASYSGYTISARAQSSLNCKMLFVGENLDSGELIRIQADAVELSPEGDFGLISADGEFLEFTLSGTLKVPDGETYPFTLEVIS